MRGCANAPVSIGSGSTSPRTRCGEAAALDWIVEKFGVEFPQKGMVLAMGTHRRWEGQWLINGVLRANPATQMTML